jgi:heptosyltransferase II
MRVALFLPNWVGDVVMATPAVRALREAHPCARVVGVLKPYVRGVIDGAPWFDDLIFHDPKGGRGQGTLAVARRLRAERIDLAVIFPNTLRSALAAWLGGCRRRVGYRRYGRGPLLTDALDPVTDPRGRLAPSPVLDAYNRVAERAGALPTRRMELFTTPADEAAADAVWRQGKFLRRPEVVALNPGAAFGASKYWSADAFATVARRCAAERGSGVLVLCGPAERDLARHIVARAASDRVHSLADAPLSLGLTKACVRRCDLLVATDSGPRHFAAAFDRPVVTLFGPTHVAWTETYFAKAVHLQKEVECGPCQLRVCPLDHRCMTRLTPDEVYAAARQLLARFPPARREGRHAG